MKVCLKAGFGTFFILITAVSITLNFAYSAHHSNPTSECTIQSVKALIGTRNQKWRRNPFPIRAAPHTISEKLSFEEFKSLLILGVTNFKVLKPLWEWQDAKRVAKSKVFIAGGQVRLIISFMSRYLQTHNKSQLRKKLKSGLSSSDLNSKVYRDIDLYLPARYEEIIDRNNRILSRTNPRNPTPSQFRQEVEAYERDYSIEILPQLFFRKAIAFGGPTLDKIRLNRFTIDDPTDALRAYYNGINQFVIVPKSEYWSHNKRNSEPFIADTIFSRTSDIVRFMRFGMLFPELAINDAQIEKLKSLISEDYQHIYRYQGGSREGKLARIIQQIKKFAASAPNWVRATQYLMAMGIIDLMIEKNAETQFIPTITGNHPWRLTSVPFEFQKPKTHQFIQSLIRGGFTLLEILKVEKAAYLLSEWYGRSDSRLIKLQFVKMLTQDYARTPKEADLLRKQAIIWYPYSLEDYQR